jgi:hypothetical protein
MKKIRRKSQMSGARMMSGQERTEMSWEGVLEGKEHKHVDGFDFGGSIEVFSEMEQASQERTSVM